MHCRLKNLEQYQFKDYLTKEIEKHVNKLPQVLFKKDIKVAYISFAYSNGELLHLFQMRGTEIKMAHFRNI
jgi:hypothetical protein